MRETREFLQSLGLPGRDLNELPDSARRFPDGCHYRIEIPSTEGPRALRAVVGSEHVLADGDLVASYETDWTRRYSGRALAVVRPATTAEVSGVLAECQRAGVAVVPQGGNTGLVGGSVPRNGEVVLSTRRMNEVVALDPVAREATVDAGVTAAQLAGQITTGSELTSIRLNAGGSYTLTFDQGPGSTPVVADHVVLALPFSMLSDVNYARAGFEPLKVTAIRELPRSCDHSAERARSQCQNYGRWQPLGPAARRH